MKALIPAALAASLGVPAWAQEAGPFCGPSDTAALFFAQRYMELEVAPPADYEGFPARRFENPGTGSFSEVVDLPNGQSCVIASDGGERGFYAVPLPGVVL